MRFMTSEDWDYSTIIAVSKLDGSPAVEGKDYRLYKDGDQWDPETGVILTEGTVLYRVPTVSFSEPDEEWIATIRGNRLIRNKPVVEKNPLLGRYLILWASCKQRDALSRVKA